MVKNRLARAVLSLTVICALGVVVAGCGGGGEAGQPQPVPGETGTINGHVVDATDVSKGLENAQVSVASTQQRGRVVMSGTDGEFTLTGVPAGIVRVDVKAPSTAFRSATVDIDVPQNGSVEVWITLLPISVALPASVAISPVSSSVQVNVPKQFTATVLDSRGNPLSVSPTWTVSAQIGTIDVTGMFVGAAEGDGIITATAGNATGTASVTVTPATAPEISGLTAAPTTLGTSGGDVLFTAHVEAGGRIKSVVLRVQAAGGSPVDVPLTPVEGSSEFEASYQYTYTFGPNSSPGFTEDQVYTVKIVATDMRGLSSQSDPVTVVVLGAETPPPTPS